MSIDWPIQLIKDIASRRCVIFLGSGISANSINQGGLKPPTWWKFLHENIDRLPDTKDDYRVCARKYLDEKDYLMACEVLRKALGRHRFVEVLRESFMSPGYREADIHKDIFDLDSRIVISPNFDKIYETYVLHETQSTTVVKNYTDNDIVECIRSNNPLIIKMHGSIDTPDSIIFTRKDYALAWNQYPQFYKIVESLLISHTFLFLGAGISDPDIKLLLESTAFSYGISRRHYFVLPEESLDPISREIMSETLNLEFLTYEKDDTHSRLKAGLKELKLAVESARNM